MGSIYSITNILKSVERLCWDHLAWPDTELLISKNDYDARIDELTAAKSAYLWNVSDITRSHHWSAELSAGATTFQDFGLQKLYTMTDKVKLMLDNSFYIPVYDYTGGEPNRSINTVILAGPVKWLPIITESNGFKTSLFNCIIKYAQSNYP